MGGADFLFEAFWNALKMIFSGDGQVYGAVFVSLEVAGIATAISSAIGLPLGFLLAVNGHLRRQKSSTYLSRPSAVV